MKRFTEESATVVPDSREKKLEDALLLVVEHIIEGAFDANFRDTLMPDHSTEKKLYYQTEFCVDWFVERLEGCGPAYDLLKNELDEAMKCMMDEMEE